MATPNRDHMPLSHSAAQINPATSKTISRYLYAYGKTNASLSRTEATTKMHKYTLQAFIILSTLRRTSKVASQIKKKKKTRIALS